MSGHGRPVRKSGTDLTIARGAHGLVASMALAAGVVMTAPSAQAHDWLVSSNPAAGASVSKAPADVALTFNEPVLTKPAAPRVAVLGPDGKHYETGCAGAEGARVSAAWTPGAPGRYTVEWRVISADGHPVSDSISFTYTGSSGSGKGADVAPKCDGTQADSSTTSGAASVPGASAGSGAATTQGSAASSAPTPPSTSSDGDAAPLYVAGAAGFAALAAVGVLVVRSRRRPGEAIRGDDSDGLETRPRDADSRHAASDDDGLD